MPKQPTVLLIKTKWCDNDPDKGTSYSEHMLRNSLENTGLAAHTHVFYYDEWLYNSTDPKNVVLTPEKYVLWDANEEAFVKSLIEIPSVDDKLITICKELCPDCIILSMPRHPRNPKYETFKKIYEELGIPILPIWWDATKGGGGCCSTVEGALQQYTDCFIGHILPDGMNSSYVYTNPLYTWTPEDNKLYNNPGLKRDIDISYIGSLASKPIGRSHIAQIKYNTNMVLAGGRIEGNKLSNEEYANYYKRSKITLNFPTDSIRNTPQLKGRVFEATACGTMLLQPVDTYTHNYFTPRTDYVEYSSKKELLSIVNYYLEHDNERIAIADSGCKKTTEIYNATNWWKEVFTHIKKIHPQFNYE